MIASVIKKKDNNIGEKDYVILLFIFQVRFREKRHNVVCDSRRLFQLYFALFYILNQKPKRHLLSHARHN